jgi:hypothetical protein
MGLRSWGQPLLIGTAVVVFPCLGLCLFAVFVLPPIMGSPAEEGYHIRFENATNEAIDLGALNHVPGGVNDLTWRMASHTTQTKEGFRERQRGTSTTYFVGAHSRAFPQRPIAYIQLPADKVRDLERTGARIRIVSSSPGDLRIEVP